jgi:hypothetical protein
MNLKNITNDDQLALGRVFHDMPKAVLAAIACSAYRQHGYHDDRLQERIAHEWVTLHANGIVHNKPTKHVREVAQVYADSM